MDFLSNKETQKLIIIASALLTFSIIVILIVISMSPQTQRKLENNWKKYFKFSYYKHQQSISRKYDIKVQDTRVKVKIAFEFNNSDVEDEIYDNRREIDRTIINIIKTTSMINSPQMQRILKVKIKHYLNKKLKDGQVTNVYFTEFILCWIV